jgi:tetratricopeptide (TPR) repeat protein
LEHYRALRFREAIHEFELSVAEMPSAEIWFDIARAHEQLAEYDLAIENYRRYLRDRVDAPDAQDVAHRIELLSSRLEAAGAAQQQRPRVPAALAIDATQSGALVLLDGRQLGIGPFDRIVEVAPGRHRLDVTRTGYMPFRAEVEVQAGALSAAYVEMHPLTQPHPTSAPRFWTWCALGASATALLSSGALGFEALQRRNDGDSGSARRWARASDAALGGALVLAVTATILYFAEGSQERAR